MRYHNYNSSEERAKGATEFIYSSTAATTVSHHLFNNATSNAHGHHGAIGSGISTLHQSNPSSSSTAAGAVEGSSLALAHSIATGTILPTPMPMPVSLKHASDTVLLDENNDPASFSSSTAASPNRRGQLWDGGGVPNAPISNQHNHLHHQRQLLLLNQRVPATTTTTLHYNHNSANINSNNPLHPVPMMNQLSLVDGKRDSPRGDKGAAQQSESARIQHGRTTTTTMSALQGINN